MERVKGWLYKDQSKKSADGRDQWSSRSAYVLASMGGAVGFGNMLRYPSQVFNNNGLQWFIPYLLAITLLAIPTLILEVALGQAYRGGTIVSYNSMSKRARGVGLGMIYCAMMICLYYVPMLSWVLKYFQHSFSSPLPWEGRVEEFYYQNVTKHVEPVGGFDDDGNITGWMTYPGTAIDPIAVAWTFFGWFVVWLSLAKGVATTGKVVYFTMGFPIIMLIVFIGRGVSLENARRGICLMWCEFNGSKLAEAQIWQAALGQVFYSTGVGFGYFTAYASFNSQQANAVADAIIICCSNAGFETLAAFAVFGIVGYLGMTPEADGPVSSFSLGFLTFPEAAVQLPGAQVWSVLFFLTLFLLGQSSSFAMFDAFITMIYDADWAKRYPRIVWSTGLSIIAFLISLMYCTEVGYYLLDAIDVNTNNFGLLFIVGAECMSTTVLYRYKDVVGQVGRNSFLIHNVGGYLGGMVIGLIIAHTASPGGGAGAGFGIYFGCVVASIVMAKKPDAPAPRFWGKNVFLNKLWWLAFYSGNQLRRDLNITVAPPGSGNWTLPWYWPVCLRYVTAPILVIVFSFGYPSFIAVRNDPLHVFAFIVAHIMIVLVITIFIVPRALNVLIPVKRREEGDRAYAPLVLCGLDDIRVSTGIEAGEHYSEDRSSDSDGLPVGEKYDGGKKNPEMEHTLR